jgi:hypothetical protein
MAANKCCDSIRDEREQQRNEVQQTKQSRQFSGVWTESTRTDCMMVRNRQVVLAKHFTVWGRPSEYMTLHGHALLHVL